MCATFGGLWIFLIFIVITACHHLIFLIYHLTSMYLFTSFACLWQSFRREKFLKRGISSALWRISVELELGGGP